ncbi:MAG TPA: tetratricopeptide repeat protein [Gemmataceae bacterium]|nr:tetratricopeptide repeat protein [Gemmataceae bacterium]
MTEPSLPQESIFLQAVEIPSAAERAAFLGRACGNDSGLRAEVEALLRAHAQSGDMLDLPEKSAVTTGPAVTETPGTVIGRYKLLQQIGEGGMGTVFMAEQTEPVQRKVALKVIKAGMDSAQVIARFEAERQALAMMDHVNIARVFDAGATESGRPYFVMELVHGVPITKYCDDNHLTPRERLELFVPVCQAIQHAHQKGIIHRDIKPTNVMITLYDGKPVPKVIDFGVAKATEQKLTERMLFTQYGTMVGTLEYMSPEQAEMSALGADTRSDIYSLGVLLYELLTGSTPLTHKRVRDAAYGEVLRMIREEEPPKPSTRLSDSGEALASISAQRHMEPAKLTKLMRGELDWIVLKALEKDRNRRYETANGFAADVQRYLADEPVQACPPSASYRLRKLLRRNKRMVLAASLVVLALVVGILGTTWGLMKTRQQRDAAEEARNDEVVQHREAEQQRIQAVEQKRRAEAAEALAKDRLAEVTRQKQRTEEEAAIAKAVNDFLQNDMLAQAAPEKNARIKKVTVEEVLGRAASRIAGKFQQQPRIEAAIRLTIGDTYRALADYAAAQPHLERAVEICRRVLGEEHPDTLASMNDLAVLYQAQGQFAKAEQLYSKTVEIRRRVQGEEHPDTLGSMNNLAALYQAQGKLAKAEPLCVKTLEFNRRVLGEEHPDTLGAMNNLAALYQAQGQYARAEQLFVKTLEVVRRVSGVEHPHTLVSMNNLANLYAAQGQYARAESLFVQTLEIRRRVLGEEHSSTLTSMNTLAALYQAQEQFAKAEPLFLKTLEARRRVLGEEHPQTLTSTNNLAMLYRAQGKLAKAEPLFVKTLESRCRVLGEEHPDTLRSMNNLAGLYWNSRRLALAIPLFEAAFKLRKAKLGPDHPETLLTMASLGVNYRDAGRLKDAVPLLEDVDRRIQALPPTSSHSLRWVRAELADAYERAGQPEKGETLRREQVHIMKLSAGPDAPAYAGTLLLLGLNLLQQKNWTDAEAMLRICLAIREKKEADAWTTFHTKSVLGSALVGQKKYADAESLLLAGYEGMKQREARIPSSNKLHLAEVMERLVQLYDTWGKKDKASEWREKWEKAKTRQPHE